MATTGVTPSTFTHLELNAGVILKNFDYSSVTDKATLATAIKAAVSSSENWIGATRGGGSFDAKPTTREIDADGKRAPFVGSTIIDGWDVKLSANLLEMTPENLKLAIGACSLDTTSTTKKVLTFNNDIAASDYIEHVCWIGDISDGSYVLIEIDNGLNTSGLSMSFADKDEGLIPIELTAHNDSVDDQSTAPCRVIFFS